MQHSLHHLVRAWPCPPRSPSLAARVGRRRGASVTEPAPANGNAWVRNHTRALRCRVRDLERDREIVRIA